MNQIERHVLELIGENTSSPDVFADTDDGMKPIRDSINDAVQEIAMIMGGRTGTFTIPLKPNRTFYRIRFEHGYLGCVQSVWLANQKRRLAQTDMIKLGHHDTRWIERAGTPSEYFLVGVDVIGLYPRSSAATDAVDLVGYMIPKAYATDTAPLDVRAEFRWMVAYFAVAEFYASRGDAASAAEFRSRYVAMIPGRARYPMYKERERIQRTKKEPWQRSAP